MSNIIRGLRHLSLIAMIGSASFSPVHLAAAESATPSMTTATFKNWTVRCRTQKGEKTYCEMVQGIRANNSTGMLAKLALGRMPGDNKLHMIIQLPLGIDLPNGVAISAGKSASANAAFETCFPGLCIAQTIVTAELLDAFKAGDTLTVDFKNRAKKPVSVKVSLAGFTAAYNSSLQEE